MRGAHNVRVTYTGIAKGTRVKNWPELGIRSASTLGPNLSWMLIYLMHLCVHWQESMGIYWVTKCLFSFGIRGGGALPSLFPAFVLFFREAASQGFVNCTAQSAALRWTPGIQHNCAFTYRQTGPMPNALSCKRGWFWVVNVCIKITRPERRRPSWVIPSAIIRRQRSSIDREAISTRSLCGISNG